jgi:hypothetical protein
MRFESDFPPDPSDRDGHPYNPYVSGWADQHFSFLNFMLQSPTFIRVFAAQFKKFLRKMWVKIE